MEKYSSHEKFYISFSFESISSIKELSKYITKYDKFFYLLQEVIELDDPIFKTKTERRLATWIISNNRKTYLRKSYLLEEEDIMREVTRLLSQTFHNGCMMLPQNITKDMLDGYIMNIISNICGTHISHTRIIGESVKRFIIIKNYSKRDFPSELYNVIEGACPLVNHPNSPLNKEELVAIYDYLGSRKNIYVHILLNCLYEMGRQHKILMKELLTKEEFISIILSPWMYLFLSTYGDVNFCLSDYNLEIIDDYKSDEEQDYT